MSENTDAKIVYVFQKLKLPWRMSNKLSASDLHKSYGIHDHNPSSLSSSEYWVDLCASVQQAISYNKFWVMNKTTSAPQKIPLWRMTFHSLLFFHYLIFKPLNIGGRYVTPYAISLSYIRSPMPSATLPVAATLNKISTFTLQDIMDKSAQRKTWPRYLKYCWHGRGKVIKWLE